MRHFKAKIVLAALFCVAAFSQPSATVLLGDSLRQWKSEIEQLGRREVVVARVYSDRRARVFLPPDTKHRDVLVPYFQNTNFLRQLLHSQALTVNQGLDSGETIHFVLLNMAKSAEWAGHEDALIAREFGHIWLAANGYEMPAYEGKKDSCLAVLATDSVQSGLIHEEIDRRGIDYLGFWLPLLDTAVQRMNTAGGPSADSLSTCVLLSKLELWLDVRLTLSPEKWPNYDHFEQAMRTRYGILKKTVEYFQSILAARDLHDHKTYLRTLQEIMSAYYGFVQGVLKRVDIRDAPNRIWAWRKPAFLRGVRGGPSLG